MRRTLIHIDRVNWDVVLMYHVSCANTAEVMDVLHYFDISDEDAELSIANLDACRPDNGITYSNYARGVSVMVIGVTTSVWEWGNTFVHECIHLAAQIAEALDMDFKGEPIAYAIGEFARDAFRRVFWSY